MNNIKCLMDHIDEELEDAMKYAEAAEKTEHADISMLYGKLASEEIGHAEALHAHAAALMEHYKGDHNVMLLWQRENEWFGKRKHRVYDKLHPHSG